MARPTKRSLRRAEAAAKLKIHQGVSTYGTAAKAAVFNNFAQPATNLLSNHGPKTWVPIRCDLTLPHTHQNVFVRTCVGLPLRGCHSQNTLGCLFSYLHQSFKERKASQRYFIQYRLFCLSSLPAKKQVNQFSIEAESSCTFKHVNSGTSVWGGTIRVVFSGSSGMSVTQDTASPLDQSLG